MSRLRPSISVGFCLGARLGSCLGARLGCCLIAAGVLAARPAVAATLSDLETALDYQADADCPGRDRFFALLDGAIDPPEWSRVSTAPDLRIRVEIRAGAGGYRGRMELDLHVRLYPAGALAEEVQLLRVRAFIAKGDARAARQTGETFLQRHPASPLRARFRSLMNALDAPAIR